MDQGVLVSGSLGEGADLVRKLGMRWPVKAAFWFRGSDDDWGNLYIAVEGLKDMDSRLVYRSVSDIAREASYPDFDDDRVFLIDAGRPMARAAIELNEQYPNPKGHRNGPRMFGDVFAEDVYVYPMPLPTAVG
jgi:hypothetical protein